MQGFSLRELLDAFKALEHNNDAVPVLNDDDAMKVLIAWSKLDPVWERPRAKMPAFTPNNRNAVWLWLALGWDIDITSVSRGAGVSESVARTKLEVLQHNRLIYPDGTMSGGAKLALDIYVSTKLPRSVPQQPKKKAEKKDDTN
jgi:hypothetical protein